MSRVGDRIRVLRLKRGYSQSELAEGISRTTGIDLKRSALGNYELGIREPDLDMIEAFADFFDVSIADLMGREEDRPQPEAQIITDVQTNVVPDVERAALAASETLIRHHIDNAPIFPMSILQSMPNVIVMTFTEMADKSGMDRTNLVTMFGSDTQDVITYLRGNEYCVAYNQRLPYYMLQRAMARELGHILLGHHTSTLPEQTQTMEALYFSRYLLCPRPLLKRLFDAGINMTVETLGNITGLYGRSLAGIRETPGAHIPARMNCKIRDQFTGYLQRAMDYIKSESVENVAKATFGSYMDNYEE